jgi:hypothetical protein
MEKVTLVVGDVGPGIPLRSDGTSGFIHHLKVEVSLQKERKEPEWQNGGM